MIPHNPVRYLRALRAFSLPLSLLPILVATAATNPPSAWRWDLLASALAAVGLLHLAGNLFNDYFDFRSGVDSRTADDEGRPGRLLVRGELPPRSVLREAIFCLLLAVPFVGYLVRVCGPELLWFFGGAAFGLYAYTGSPFRLKYRALGEVLIFAVFGPALMIGAAWVQIGGWQSSVFWLSLPIGCGTAAVVAGNNLRDFDEDREAGIVTLAHIVGRSRARILYVALLSACVLGVAAVGIIRGPSGLAATPLLLALHIKPLATVIRGGRSPNIDMSTAALQTVVLFYMLGLLIFSGGMP